MDVDLLDDPARFASSTAGWLAADPFSTNVIGVHLAGVLAGSRASHEDDAWIVATELGDVVGAAMHTPPYNVFVPRLPSGVASAMALALLGAGRPVPGVNGELAAVSEFAAVVSAETGRPSSVERATRMYRLAELRPPARVAGEARPTTEGDRDLVKDWLVRFRAEASPESPMDPDEMVGRRIVAGELWLWCLDGVPVSLAGRSAPAAGVARVGPVYTTPDRRRNGFGAAVTARASQDALDAGAEHVVLYTDLSNPTSNSVYQRIGYVTDHDAEERAFG